jgi:cell division protein FtsI (penicillin-binding protein 3)
MKARILILFSIFLGAWGLLIGRAMMLQIFPDGRLENLKRRQFETTLDIHTRRGAILDRDSSELGASIPSWSLFADPKLLKATSEVTHRLAKYLDLSPRTLRKHLRDHERRFVWVKRQLTERQKSELESWDIAGLGFIEEPKRVYPNGSLMSQVLGLVGSEGNGLDGLELQYDKYLRGQIKQVLLPRDARGRPLLPDGRSLTEVPDGADIQLTIDHEVQFKLERELQSVVERFSANSAVGMVVDAQTSEILAMANVPTADLNDGIHYAPEMRRNRVVTDAFEPGSVMKTFVIASALRENIVKPGTRYYCEGGQMKIGDKWIHEAEKRETYQWLTVTEILAHSSNVGAAKIAFDVGDERLAHTLYDFGFGAKTGVDLPGESRGIMNPMPWRPHLLANIAFGQGIAVNTVQLVNAYTAIANGGLLKRPLLVKSIRSHDHREPLVEFQAEELRRVLTPQQAATMRLMLTAATGEKSTGYDARIPGYYVAGKTGTAQKVDPKGGYSHTAYVSSFAGFVPANAPRFVIYVAVDSPKKAYYGSQVAAPVFSKMAQYLVRRAGLPPGQISEQNVILAENDRNRSNLQAQALKDIQRAAADSEQKGFPNLMGLSLREALHRIHEQASQIEVRGHGTVVRTIPSAGSTVGSKSRVTLVLENPDHKSSAAN